MTDGVVRPEERCSGSRPEERYSGSRPASRDVSEEIGYRREIGDPSGQPYVYINMKILISYLHLTLN